MEYYKCNDCGCEFEYPDEVHTTYESYYGVSDLFGNSHSLSYEVCPRCGSEDFKEVDDEDEEA